MPLTFDAEMLTRCKSMSGLSVGATIHCQRAEFSEGLLFTDRGMSGPSILQISLYWHDGMPLTINSVPGTNIATALKDRKRPNPQQDVLTRLSDYLPKRLASDICMQAGMDSKLTAHNGNRLDRLGVAVNRWQLLPVGTEGYRIAEVTLGGVDTADLLSSTMRSKHAPGLCFIGEVVDVTGHLGGYNFHWAWSSVFFAGQHAQTARCQGTLAREK